MCPVISVSASKGEVVNCTSWGWSTLPSALYDTISSDGLGIFVSDLLFVVR